MPPSPNNPSPILSAPPQPKTTVWDVLRSFGPTIFAVVVAVVVVLLALNRQSLSDWWRLHGYQAPAAVTRLADQDTMNAYTRHLFYLNRPQLPTTVAAFRQHCPENENTIVLGCYHPDQNGIYIYAVQDPALAGIQQVTAAHEVLHAVYARLSGAARTQLDSELESFYKHGLTNQRVLAEVKLYQQTEPKDVMDEMSCTFGTEVANLPPALEAYYKHYFNNRSAIVAYEQQYEAEFTSRQNNITADDQQLAGMKSQIDAQQAALSFQLAQINSDRTRLNRLLSSGQTAAYNTAVPGYNNEISTYNDGINSLRSSIDSYNQLVVTRNQIAGQLTTLTSAIDTRLMPQAVH